MLVIGAGGKARAITGYTQAKEIDQAVSDIGGKGFEARKAFQHTGFAKQSPTTPARTSATPSTRRPTRRRPSPALSKALGDRRGRARRTRAIAWPRPRRPSADERKLKSALVAFADHDVKWVAEAAQRKLKAGAEPGTVFLTLVQRESDGNNAYVAAAKKLRVRGCYADGLIDAAPGLHWPGARRALRGASAPPGRPRPRPAAHDGAAGGAACGDLVRIGVAVDGDRVADAGFEASGCGAPLAAGSAAVELVRGRGRPRRRARRHARDLRRARRPEPRQAPRRRARRRRAAPRAGRARWPPTRAAPPSIPSARWSP